MMVINYSVMIKMKISLEFIPTEDLNPATGLVFDGSPGWTNIELYK